ncbi:uncharacterized protein [Amphiura filiformis]|uniref:uncharacterized protein n=1 Tax=Amphiura filiformis TaxID=82378 RepID=UPI003B227AA5
MSSGLLVHNSLEVNTNHGNCRIELCIGDITKLPVSDQVDVVLVSAFPWNYSPTPRTLLGALKSNLNIDVNKMSKNKSEDLRSMYNCWISQSLPDGLPFKRLLCFETKLNFDHRPSELIGNIFRCLVPVLSDKDGSVITPLLSTGNQGYNEENMLASLTETAMNWMKAGLPLKLLKIVLFARIEDGKVNKSFMRRHEDLCRKFDQIKETYSQKEKEEYDEDVPSEYDVYLSCSEKDSNIATKLEEELQKARPDIKICKEYQKLDKDSAWQTDMYDIMRKCARVVPVLTPNYLTSLSCLEQYHLALCCNRRTRRHLLAPLYVHSVENLPTYISLVQYVDCRENDETKLAQSCSDLAKSIPVRKAASLFGVPIQYDVFVSYSHRDSEPALEIVKILKDMNPDLRIFFDVQELKTGTSWQRALYHAIDASQCLLAVISKAYLSSAVCQEEYSLALAKHCSINTIKFRLVPICIDEDIDGIPDEFKHIEVVDAPKATFTRVVRNVCESIVKGTVDDSESNKSKFIGLDSIAMTIRRQAFRSKFGTKTQLVSTEMPFPPPLTQILPMSEEAKPKSSESPDIIISFADKETKKAEYLARLLREAAPELIIVYDKEPGRERLTMVENSNRVVVLLSPTYIENQQLVEEFQSAVWRQRLTKYPVLFPIKCSPLPPLPTYFHIVPHYIDINDPLWTEVRNRFGICLPGDTPSFANEYKRSFSGEVSVCLQVAAVFLLQSIRDERMEGEREEERISPKPALLNAVALSKQVETHW